MIEKNMTKPLPAILALQLMILAVGCGPSGVPPTSVTAPRIATVGTNLPSRFGSNSARKSIGLRVIKSGWQFDALYFKNSKGDNAKRLHRDETRKIVLEEDFYYTGRTFTDIDGTRWERLVLQYDYTNKTIHVHAITTNPTVKALVATYEAGTTNLSAAFIVADKVLLAWGLRRL